MQLEKFAVSLIENKDLEFINNYKNLKTSFVVRIGKSPLTFANINNCSTDLDRIRLLKPYADTSSLLSDLENTKLFEKCAETSVIFREQGNIFYKSADVSRALRAYNLSIAFAPCPSTESALAFANRSALFVHMKEPTLALEDIEIALTNNYPENQKQKLLDRRKKCEELMRKDIKNTPNANLNYFKNQFYKLDSQNEKLANAINGIDLDFAPDRGRRLMAAKPIGSGTSLIVEKPYVSTLQNVFKWDTEHCHNCATPILGGIPCHQCTFCIYCSEECLKEDATTVHHLEHKLFSYLVQFKELRRELLIIRIILKVGSRNLFDMYSGNGLNLSLKDGQIGGLSSDGHFDPKSYLSIYHLISHRHKYGTDASYEKGPELKAIALCSILKDTVSEFFSGLPFSEKHGRQDFEDFIASIILHHLENVQYNVLSFSEFRIDKGPLSNPFWVKVETKSSSKSGINTSIYSKGVFPLISVCNHSCDPNATFIKSTKDSRTAVVTLRSIQSGQEIVVGYTSPFTQKSLQERLEYLWDNYKFECHCPPCVFKWGVGTRVLTAPRFCTTNCVQNAKGVIVSQCGQCSAKEQRMNLLEAKLYEAENFLKQEEFIQVVETLKPCIDFLSSHFDTNLVFLQLALEMLRTALVRLIHC